MSWRHLLLCCIVLVVSGNLLMSWMDLAAKGSKGWTGTLENSLTQSKAAGNLEVLNCRFSDFPRNWAVGVFLNILVPQISWLVFPFDQQFWYLGWPSDQGTPAISGSKDSLLNRSSWQLCWSWAMPDHFPGWWFVRILVLVSACDSACFAVQLKVFKSPLLWWLYGAQYDVKYGWWS